MLVVVALVSGLALSAPTLSGTASDATSTGTGVASEHPHLLFDADDVAGITAGTESGERRKAWLSLQRRLDSYTDRTSPWFVDGSQTYTGAQNQAGTYLADLGLRYALTGEKKAARPAIDILLTLPRNSWPGWNNNELGEGDTTKEAALAFTMPDHGPRRTAQASFAGTRTHAQSAATTDMVWGRAPA